MSTILDEIEDVIHKFKNNSRIEIIQYYYTKSEETLLSRPQIGYQEVELLNSVCKFIDGKQQEELINKILKIKIMQIQTFILNNHKDNYSHEKKYFSKVSNWMKSLIEEINGIFMNKTNKTEKTNLEQEPDQQQAEGNDLEICGNKLKLFKIFNTLLCDEIYKIFCSSEKFNSSGNQLLINLHFYYINYSKYDKSPIIHLIKLIRDNFNPGKVLDENEIKNIVEK